MDIEFTIRLHEKQLEIFESPARFKVVACGRRFGKTTLASYEVIYKALTKPNSIIWIVAPTYPLSMIAWRKITELVPREAVKSINKVDRVINLVTGSEIWAKSAHDPDLLRGEGLDFVVIDEAAMVKREAWEQALRPALADKHGSAMFISTPKGKNWFYECFMRGQDKEQTEWESFQYPTFANPFISKAEIEAMRKSLPELTFKQEILAEFVEGGGVVFKNVTDCIAGKLEEPKPNKHYVMGVDLAKYEDYTVIVVMDVKTKHVVHFERFTQIDWSYQKRKIAEIAKRYNNAHVVIDSTGVGDPIYEDLIKAGLNVEGFKITSTTKPQLIQNLMIRLENKEISFPKIDELINELSVFSFEMTPQGYVRYQAPPGFHDDCVIALALAVWGLERYKTGAVKLGWGLI